MLALVALAALWYWFRPEKAFIDRTVEEADVQGQVILRGEFRGIAHETEGKAVVVQSSHGNRVLRLSDFKTSDGPEVEVYLVAAEDAPDDESVTTAGFISLGALKGNLGSQNYVIPPNTDMTKHRCVAIWCKRFGVNFGVAPLRE
jgi:hypothetical protein